MGRQRFTGGKQGDAGRESGKLTPSLRAPERGLPQVLGNRMVTHLLGQERIQAKSRDDASGDPLEHEADQAAASVATPPKSDDAESPPSAAAPKVAGPALLVEDDSESVQPGQMSKTDFLSELRAAVCATADEGLAAVGKDTAGCPWIDYWINQYSGKDASHLERALLKFAPEAAGATSARGYIPAIAARVRKSVDQYAKTGEVVGAPEEMPDADPGAMEGISFKARDGGAKSADNPAAVRGQLGPGRPLDSGVRGQMESAFGVGFSGVRLHTDSGAASLSDRFNARAFTVGEHVAFAAGEYQPDSVTGQALIAHELAHVVQQSGTGVQRSSRDGDGATSGLEQDADNTAVRAVVSIVGGMQRGLANVGQNAMPMLKSGLRLQRCKSDRQKEIDRLGNLQSGYLEDKRKAEEARQKKEAEDEAKKKGLPPPVNAPKVDMGDVIKKDEEKHALKGSPTTQWDTADQPKWKKRAAAAWAAVVVSVKGTELEDIAKGVTFNFDPAAALTGGFYASQNGHTLTVGMSWVEIAELDPKNVWENLAHEMAGHFKYGTTYASEIMDSALSKLSAADRTKFIGDPQKFFETYSYPETEIYASLWQRRYRVPVGGTERPSGGIHPDQNITNKLNVMLDALHPEVAKAVLKELKRRVDANDQILQRDKDFFVAKVKEIFGYGI